VKKTTSTMLGQTGRFGGICSKLLLRALFFPDVILTGSDMAREGFNLTFSLASFGSLLPISPSHRGIPTEVTASLTIVLRRCDSRLRSARRSASSGTSKAKKSNCRAIARVDSNVEGDSYGRTSNLSIA